MIRSEGGARRPGEFATSQQVHMDVRNCLSCILTIVYHYSVALLEFLGSGDVGGSQEEFPENLLVFFLSFGETCEPIFVLGDDDNMDGSHRSDISEGEDVLILVYNVGWDLFVDKFVENGLFSHARYVYKE